MYGVGRLKRNFPTTTPATTTEVKKTSITTKTVTSTKSRNNQQKAKTTNKNYKNLQKTNCLRNVAIKYHLSNVHVGVHHFRQKRVKGILESMLQNILQ
jgi:hypothetical protein